MLLRKNDAVIFDNFISEQEQEVLLKWANVQLDEGRLSANYGGQTKENANEPVKRFYNTYEHLTNIPTEFWVMRDRVKSKLEIVDSLEEPRFKCFLGCNIKGGAIHPHVDTTIEGFYHIRCNLLLSMPTQGGTPVVNGTDITVGDRGIWCFMPSENLHWSTTVVGDDKKRFTCSYGFLVRKKQSQRIYCREKTVDAQSLGKSLGEREVLFLRTVLDSPKFEIAESADKAGIHLETAESIVNVLVNAGIMKAVAPRFENGRLVLLPEEPVEVQIARMKDQRAPAA